MNANNDLDLERLGLLANYGQQIRQTRLENLVKKYERKQQRKQRRKDAAANIARRKRKTAKVKRTYADFCN